MNRDKWNSLPRDIQAAIEGINQEWIVKTGEAWDSSDEVGREYAIAQGNEIIKLDKEESDRWAEAVFSVITDYVANTKEKGLPGQDYVDFIRASLKKGKK